MIQILDDPNVLTEIFEKEFDCLPPHPDFGDVIAIIEDGEIKAFMSRETLIHVGTVWVNPKDRKTAKAGRWLKDLARQVILGMPKNSSTIIVDETGLYAKLLKFLGFRTYKGTTYRIDLSDI